MKRKKRKGPSLTTLYGCDAGRGRYIFSTMYEHNPKANLVLKIDTGKIKKRESVPVLPRAYQVIEK